MQFVGLKIVVLTVLLFHYNHYLLILSSIFYRSISFHGISCEYQLHQCLIDALKTHAPPSLSQKSIHSIANDIHPIDRLFFTPMSHSYQWIHLAISDYQNDPIMVQYTNEIQTIIQSVAVWIESHYNELIIFGFNRHQYHELTQLISLVNLPIHWVLPSLKTKLRVFSFLTASLV